MKPELEKLLKKVVQGEPGSYQKFLAERRNLKGGCSYLEFITYISEQKDITQLDHEVYGDLSLQDFSLTSKSKFIPLESKLVALLKTVISNPKVNTIQSLGAFCLLIALDLYLKDSHTTLTPGERKQWFEKCHAMALNPQQESASFVKNCLAFMYLYGVGIEKNVGEALKWLQQAAAQGFANAQYSLGLMYINGRGVEKNVGEALKWLQQAAAQGFANAQYCLGLMYINGRGVEKNDVEAMKWFRLAAEQGNAAAQRSLGFMHEQGRGGVEKNDVEAMKWFRLAADQGHIEALKQYRKWMAPSQEVLYQSFRIKNAALEQENLNLRNRIRQLEEAQVQRPLLNPGTTNVTPAPLNPPAPFSLPPAPSAAAQTNTPAPVLVVSLPSANSSTSAFAPTLAFKQVIEQGGVACYASPLNIAGPGVQIKEEPGQKRNVNSVDATDEGDQRKRHAASSNDQLAQTPTHRR